MNTLIVPCAGKSSRFPEMKPKYLLTHPDGSIMLEKAISGLNTEIFDRIIITIVKPHAEKYESEIILKQIFAKNPKVEICVLDDFTNSASETVDFTIDKMNVHGSFVIKDSDNKVCTKIPQNISNGIVGYDLRVHKDISNIPGKSFLLINDKNIILDIIEKEVVSNIICLGVYSFHNVKDFQSAYKELLDNNITGEMFISHVISYMLSKGYIFTASMADGYDDWGTLAEWQQVQKNYRTYFIDVDGVLIKNCGQYGSINWSNNAELIIENINQIKDLQHKGAQIIITTSRTEEYRDDLEKLLINNGIKPYAIIMGLNHSSRVIINDFAATNPYPSCSALSIPRNSLIKHYVQ